MKRKWVNMILGRLFDPALWPHPWPWPRIFKVRVWNSFISGMGRPIDMERKGCESSIHDHDIFCMTMILTRVTLVGWADVPDSHRVTSDVCVPSTYLVYHGKPHRGLSSRSPTNVHYLRHGEGYVFIVAPLLCLFVCLSVNNITEKRLNGFSWNFQGRWDFIQGTISNIFRMFHLTPWT